MEDCQPSMEPDFKFIKCSAKFNAFKMTLFDRGFMQKSNNVLIKYKIHLYTSYVCFGLQWVFKNLMSRLTRNGIGSRFYLRNRSVRFHDGKLKVECKKMMSF